MPNVGRRHRMHRPPALPRYTPPGFSTPGKHLYPASTHPARRTPLLVPDRPSTVWQRNQSPDSPHLAHPQNHVIHLRRHGTTCHLHHSRHPQAHQSVTSLNSWATGAPSNGHVQLHVLRKRKAVQGCPRDALLTAGRVMPLGTKRKKKILRLSLLRAALASTTLHGVRQRTRLHCVSPHKI